MSIEESTRTEAPTGAPDLPDERPYPGFVRVNLLPASLLERVRVTKAKRRAVIAVVLALLLVAGLWALAQRDISDAQARVDSEMASNQQLQAQISEYSQVPAAFATAENAQNALSSAMGSEIRWSFLLNQLSFATPPGVTLDSVSGQTVTDGSATSPGGALPAQPSVGTMTFTGTGNSFSAVASWLDSLNALKDYTYPFLTNSSKDQDGGDVTWEATANLSTNALSGTYGTPPAASSGTQSSGTPTPQPSAPSDGAR